jgi:hypothetical protein
MVDDGLYNGPQLGLSNHTQVTDTKVSIASRNQPPKTHQLVHQARVADHDGHARGLGPHGGGRLLRALAGDRFPVQGVHGGKQGDDVCTVVGKLLQGVALQREDLRRICWMDNMLGKGGVRRMRL